MAGGSQKLMEAYRKKGTALLLLLLVLSLVTGCGFQLNPPFPMEEKSSYMAAPQVQEPFSANLCVVSAKEDETKKDSSITAASALIFDITDQNIIYEENVFKRLYPASVTKILTALVVLKNGNLSDTVTVSYEASHITEWGAVLCGLNEGDQIGLKDLLYCFLIHSGNDAGIALAEHIAGTEKEFAKLMNAEAKALGATHSNFVTSHGLHNKKHYTTTYDIYLIFQEALKNEVFLDIIKTPSYTATYHDKDGNEKKLSYDNTNRYLCGKADAPKGVTVIGGKTGTTQKAGSCLALYSEGANGHSYISIVFKADGGDSLYAQMNTLLAKIPSK